MSHLKVSICTIIIFSFVLSLQTLSQTSWQRAPQNPVLSNSTALRYVFEPCVLYDSDHGYRMWFSSWTGGADGMDISYATSSDGIVWQLYAGNPVLSHGASAAWDRDTRSPSVVFDGTEYKMYYTGVNGGVCQTGLATSPDGVTWTKYGGNPVLAVGDSGAWDAKYVAWGDAHFDHGTFTLWYSGVGGDRNLIGNATSSDGIHWVKNPLNPLFTQNPSGGFDGYNVFCPRVFSVNGVMMMMYLGAPTPGCCDFSIGLAYSTDGTSWTRYGGNPVFVKDSANSWDGGSLGNFAVFRNGDTYQLWYSAQSATGGPTGTWQIGSATAPVAYFPPGSTGDTNVVAMWHFDEGQGTILHDASPYHNDGSIHNCQWVSGEFGSALHFDGTTSYGILANSPSLQPQGQFTIEASVSLDTLVLPTVTGPDDENFVIVGNLGPYPSGGGYQLYCAGSPLKFFFHYRTPVSWVTSNGVSVDQTHTYYNLAVTYRQISGNVEAKMYINGILRDSVLFNQTIQYSNTPLFYIGTNIGGRAVGGPGVREFPGIIDEVRISKVALQPQQFGSKHLSPSTTRLDFGVVDTAQSANRQLTLTNTSGRDTLAVTGITFDNPKFSSGQPSFSLAPMGQQVVTVTYKPTTATIDAGTMLITSPGADNPTTCVHLIGVGFTPSPGVDSNTVALWRFDEGGGNVLHDASPYHNDGAIHSGQWVPGKFGAALHFDGILSYVILPNSPSLQTTGDFTLEAWISPDTLSFPPDSHGSDAVILSNIGDYPCGGGYDFFIVTPGNLKFDDRSAGCVSNFSGLSAIPQARRFYHVASVYKQQAGPGSTSALVKTYIDGALTDSAIIQAPIQYASAPNFYIGTNMDGRAVGGIGVREFQGIIDEVRISNVARDPSQFDMPHGQVVMSLQVQDAGAGAATLQFGAAPGATDGLDTTLGERELPPKPPRGNFDARWVITGTQGTLLDLCDTLGGSHTRNGYVGTAQPGPGGFPITLHWDPATFPPGTFQLLDEVTNGGSYRIDMRTQNSFSLLSTLPQPFVIVYDNTPSLVASVFPAWNMVSLPLTVENRTAHAVFPTAVSEAFKYKAGYVSTDTLDYGVGYWIKFDSAQTVSVSGGTFMMETVNVASGWNMVGSVSAPVGVADIVQQPPGIIASQFFGYQNGYKSASALQPMSAYWVKTSSDGELVLTASPGHSIQCSSLPAAAAPGVNVFDVSDSKKNSVSLLVGAVQSAGQVFDASRYAAPPVPPLGAFDVRFDGDRLAAAYSPSGTDAQRFAINIHSAAYPVKVAWSVLEDKGALFSLVNPVSGAVVAADLQGKGAVLLTDKSVTALVLVVQNGGTRAVPTRYALEQNYPNPFNPTTMIQYALPRDGYVTLKVYSILGEEVATLAQGLQTAGYHSVIWDPNPVGNGMPSGIYLYRLSAGSYSAVRKMILLK